MGRAPCCDKANVKKGPWSPEEDAKLKLYLAKYGTGGNWIALPQKAGLRRCGKSCRLRWLNYLRPNIKHGEFTDDEDRIICTLFATIGSRWSIIAAQLPGRTDNDIKNYWNTKLKKKLMGHQRKPHHHQPTFSSLLQTSSSSSPSLSASPSSSSSLSYHYTPAATSFTAGLEPNISYSSPTQVLSSNSYISTAAASILQPQESLLLGPTDPPMQHYNYQVKDRLLMFGGGEAQASCSSSSDEQMGFHNFFYNGVNEEINDKFMMPNGLWGDHQASLDYFGLEEIKQLISSNNCNNLLFDENKTVEKVMYTTESDADCRVKSL